MKFTTWWCKPWSIKGLRHHVAKIYLQWYTIWVCCKNLVLLSKNAKRNFQLFLILLKKGPPPNFDIKLCKPKNAQNQISNKICFCEIITTLPVWCVELDHSLKLQTKFEVGSSLKLQTKFEVGYSLKLQTEFEVGYSLKLQTEFEVGYSLKLQTKFEVEHSLKPKTKFEVGYSLNPKLNKNIDYYTFGPLTDHISTRKIYPHGLLFTSLSSVPSMFLTQPV